MGGGGGGFCTHLPPVFEKVFPEDVLGRVVVLQHFRKEGGNFLGIWTELHVFACGEKGANKSKHNQASHKWFLGHKITKVTIVHLIQLHQEGCLYVLTHESLEGSQPN